MHTSMLDTNITVITLIIGSICCCNKIFGTVSAEGLAEYLMPPAAPMESSLSYQRYSHAKVSSDNGSHPSQNYETVPLTSSDSINKKQLPSNFLTRVVRWLGFTGTEKPVKKLQNNHQWKDDSTPYSYKNVQSKSNGACYLCNNYPWVPMLPLSVIPYSIDSFQNSIEPQLVNVIHHNNPETNTSPYNIQQHNQQQLPKNYRENRANQYYQHAISQSQKTPEQPPAHSELWPQTPQALPFTNASPQFTENVGAYSELQANHVTPTRAPYTGLNTHDFTTQTVDPPVEIIKSEILTHFVSSVEYPPQYEHSQTVDVPSNYNISVENNDQTDPKLYLNAAKYQNVLVNNNLHQRTPASQLLTKIGSFGVTQNSGISSDTPVAVYSTHKPSNQMQVISDNLSSMSAQDSQNIVKVSSWNEITNNTQDMVQMHTVPKVSEFIGRPRMPSHEQSAGESPRPFTQDPNDLNYDIGSIESQSIFHQPLLQDKVKVKFEKLIPPAPVSANLEASNNRFDAGGQYARLSPPAPPSMIIIGDTRQIIIPYTTMNQPRPFKQQWSHQHSASKNIDPYQQEESKVVAETVRAVSPPPLHSSSKHLTNILSSNLHEQLRYEQLKQDLNIDNSVDMWQLQQNIDDWTEQEFTSLSHRPSTPTIRGHSKHIPDFYLTTTQAPPPTTRIPLPQRLKSTVTFGVHDLSLSTSINNLESQFKERDSLENNDREDKKIHGFGYAQQHVNDNALNKMVKTNRFSDTTLRLSNMDRAFTIITAPKLTSTTPKSTMLNNIQTSGVDGISPTTSTSPSYNAMELWDKANVFISPLTKEKLYVVTPQPRVFPQRFSYDTTTEKSFESMHNRKTEEQFALNKIPRFLVRPSPGSNFNYMQPVSKLHTSKEFGLKNLDTFVPAKPAETISSNSKVVTNAMSVTKSANDLENMKTERPTKSTMQPLPR